MDSLPISEKETTDVGAMRKFIQTQKGKRLREMCQTFGWDFKSLEKQYFGEVRPTT